MHASITCTSIAVSCLFTCYISKKITPKNKSSSIGYQLFLKCGLWSRNWLNLYLTPSPLYGMHMGLSLHKGLDCIVIRSRQHAYTTYCQGGVTLMYPVLYDLHPLNKGFLA